MCVLSPDRQIRHRACALKDTVHAIIRDELDEDFEKICEEIKESRRKRGEDEYLSLWQFERRFEDLGLLSKMCSSSTVLQLVDAAESKNIAKLNQRFSLSEIFICHETLMGL